jgi:acetyl esterase/lipase
LIRAFGTDNGCKSECLNGPAANPDVSPLLADHTGLPSAYLQICGLDPLRDEGLLYERLLREKGIPTKLDMYVKTLWWQKKLIHCVQISGCSPWVQHYVARNYGGQEVRR